VLIIIVVVCAGAVFFLGMLIGQQLSRRDQSACDRRSAVLRRKRNELNRRWR
jgi:hypothetical protein